MWQKWRDGPSFLDLSDAPCVSVFAIDVGTKQPGFSLITRVFKREDGSMIHPHESPYLIRFMDCLNFENPQAPTLEALRAHYHRVRNYDVEDYLDACFPSRVRLRQQQGADAVRVWDENRVAFNTAADAHHAYTRVQFDTQSWGAVPPPAHQRDILKAIQAQKRQQTHLSTTAMQTFWDCTKSSNYRNPWYVDETGESPNVSSLAEPIGNANTSSTVRPQRKKRARADDALVHNARLQHGDQDDDPGDEPRAHHNTPSKRICGGIAGNRAAHLASHDASPKAKKMGRKKTTKHGAQTSSSMASVMLRHVMVLLEFLVEIADNGGMGHTIGVLVIENQPAEKSAHLPAIQHNLQGQIETWFHVRNAPIKVVVQTGAEKMQVRYVTAEQAREDGVCAWTTKRCGRSAIPVMSTPCTHAVPAPHTTMTRKSCMACPLVQTPCQWLVYLEKVPFDDPRTLRQREFERLRNVRCATCGLPVHHLSTSAAKALANAMPNRQVLFKAQHVGAPHWSVVVDHNADDGSHIANPLDIQYCTCTTNNARSHTRNVPQLLDTDMDVDTSLITWHDAHRINLHESIEWDGTDMAVPSETMHGCESTDEFTYTGGFHVNMNHNGPKSGGTRTRPSSSLHPTTVAETTKKSTDAPLQLVDQRVENKKCVERCTMDVIVSNSIRSEHVLPFTLGLSWHILLIHQKCQSLRWDVSDAFAHAIRWMALSIPARWYEPLRAGSMATQPTARKHRVPVKTKPSVAVTQSTVTSPHFEPTPYTPTLTRSLPTTVVPSSLPTLPRSHPDVIVLDDSDSW